MVSHRDLGVPSLLSTRKTLRPEAWIDNRRSDSLNQEPSRASRAINAEPTSEGRGVTMLRQHTSADRGGLMTKQLVKCRAVAQPIGPYSLAVRSENLVFVSGTVGWRPDGSVPSDIREQCRQMYENIRQVLGSAGSSLEDVVST